MISLPFASRAEAGELLAKKLEPHKNSENTIVLGLVRGGIIVGVELASKLSLPLFPYVVRKIGHPRHREFAVGAIAEGGATFLDDTVIKMHDVDWGELEGVIEEEQAELKRRKETYLVSARPKLAGKTVILTDDGAATGSTLFAAMEDMRNVKVKRLVIAIPVCPPDTALKLKEKSDESVFLAIPEDFYAVGQFYMEFGQVSDDEVIELLRNNNQ